jgi:amino acid adenylation domain-containing protein
MTQTLPDPLLEAEVFVLPTSFAQQRLWFLQQLMPENPAYNVPLAVQLTGELKAAALSQAFNEIVRRHESLRTNFRIVDGEPMQTIALQRTVPLPQIDLQELSDAAQQATVAQLSLSEFQQPFDLAEDALLRVKLLQLHPTKHVLLLTLHHIVADGWSIAVLVRELGILYSGFAADNPPMLIDLPIQYADFAHWQRQWLQGETFTRQLAYWQQQLNGAAQLDLPIDHPRSQTPGFRGARESLLLPQSLRAAIVRLSERTGTTLFMTLLAAFQTLLHRYSGQTDIVVGSPIANRSHSEIEGLIGFFVNTLVLRTDLSGNPTFRQLLGRVREVALGAYAHQDLPFEKLVEAVQPARDLHRNPLFQIVFALQNAPVEKLELAGLTLSPLAIDPGTARFDLEFQIVECLDTLGIVAVYRTDLFEPATIARLLIHFQTLLEGIVADPDCRLSDLPLLTAAERHQLLVEWNQTQTEYPQDWCIHHWFEAQVKHTPDAVAVVFANQQLTYCQLNDRCNQLAHYLQQIGVVPGLRIGVCLERSIDLLVAVLGILKAGAAYVPLDPSYPAERLQFMLEDAQVSILVAHEVTQRLVAQFTACPATQVCLTQDWQIITQCSSDNPISSVTADRLAYVIYTSGSTGQPKGVLVPHRGVSNLAQAQRQIFNVQPADRVLQFASFSFDASVFEMMLAFGAGASLYLAGSQSLLGADLIRLLQDHKISYVTLPPALLNALPDAALPDLQTVIAAGEACSSELVDRWARHRRFFNAYGLTETSVWATVGQLHPGDSVSIGRAIANTQLYVLDAQLQPVPIGVAGELYIGGDGVAQGYLNRPEATAAQFIANPFCSTAGRLYRTGDWVRYRSNGCLQFIGRVDHQVKLRGYRIELTEIEAALRQHPLIQMAVVFVDDSEHEKSLVAWLILASPLTITSSELTPSELKSFLRSTLPSYMIPAAFVVSSSLPLLPNGKIDRAAVVKRYRRRFEASQTGNKIQRLSDTVTVAAPIAPRTPTEADLAKLWADQLHLEAVGITQNFFELGGDSLQAMQLMERIQQQFGRSLPLSALFLAPTVAQLAQQIHPSTAAADLAATTPLVLLQPLGTKPPFFCVHPIFGTVFPYLHLARQMEADAKQFPQVGNRRFYGLQPLGLHSQQPPQDRIEDMAAHYIQAMRQVQPQSPYYIGGWSFGGLVAFEMAQQLHKAGQQVALLAIFDTPAPTRSSSITPGIARDRRIYRQGLQFLLTTVARSVLPFLADYGHLLIASAFSQLNRPRQFDAKTRARLLHELALRSLIEIYHANMRAFLSYAPQVYPGAITLFSAQQSPAPDRLRGWQDLTTGGVKVYPVPGNHLTMMRQPHVQTLSQRLWQCLDAE